MIRCFASAVRAALALVAACLIVNPARAQIAPPESFNPTDANGVNLQTGSLSVTTSTISIGPKDGGLNYSRSYDSEAVAWRDSVAGMVNRAPFLPPASQHPWYTVTILGASTSFQFQDGTGLYKALEGDDGTLVKNGNIFTYTASDGTKAVFAGGKKYAPFYANEGLVSSITKPDGEVITFTYSYSGTTTFRLQSVANNRGYQLQFQYSASDWSLLEKVTALNNAVDACDPAANTCAFSRTWPSLTFGGTATDQTVTDALSRTMHVFLNNGLVTGVRRPARASGQDLTIAWGGFETNKVTSVATDAGTWIYNIQDPPVYDLPPAEYTTTTTVTDPLNHTTTITIRSWEVDPLTTRRTARIIAAANSLGQTTTYGYSSTYRPASTTYPEGNSTVVLYDARGNPYSRTDYPKAGSGQAAKAMSAIYPTTCDASNYKVCNKPTSITDARGNVTAFTYDVAHGGVLTATSPEPTSGAMRPQTRTSYTAAYAWYKNNGGTIVQATSPIYLPTATSRCTSGPWECIGSALEAKTTIGYQPGSASLASNLLPLTTTSAAGDGSLTATTTMTYEPTGDVKTVDGPLPGVADTTRSYYDAMSQTTGVIGPDPDGAGASLYRASRTTYNADGQVTLSETGTATSQADNAMASFAALLQTATAYDGVGRKVRDRLLSLGGATQTQTDYGYDVANRLICQTVRMNPAAFASAPSACALGSAGTDGPDRITYTEYDAADRVTKVTSGYGTSGAYAPRVEKAVTYTSNGKEQTVADGKNNLTTYEYDGFDRLIKTRFPNASGGGSSSTDWEGVNTYDAANNVTQRRKRDGSLINYTYDALNRITYRDGVGIKGWYYYDNLGRPTFTYSGNAAERVIANYYDPLGRPTATYDYRDGAWRRSTYEWHDLAGRRTALQWADDFYVNYIRDVTGAVTAIYENASLAIGAYAYDDLGRRTYDWGGAGAPLVGHSYGYDAASRLASLGHDVPGGDKDQTWTFAYNAASQIKTRTASNSLYEWAGAQTSKAYTVNGLNQYLTAGGATLAYSDNRGNLTGDGASTFGYDLGNRLTSKTGGSAMTLSYDPISRLDTTVGASTTRLVYSGPDLIEETNATNTTLRRYVPGPGTDDPLVWYEGAGTGDRRWLSKDPQGSVVSVTTNAGAVTLNTYDEYGVPAAGNLGRFQYTGQTWISELGLYHYKARAYSPTLGRFMQTDPIGYGDGLNWYAYVGNDPVNRYDSFGLLQNCQSQPAPTTTPAPNTPPPPPPPPATCKDDGTGFTEVDEVVVVARRARKYDNDEVVRFRFSGDEQFFVATEEQISGYMPAHKYECPVKGGGTVDAYSPPSGFPYGGDPGHIHGDSYEPSLGPDDGQAAGVTGAAYMISRAGAYRINRGTNGYSATLLDGTWGASEAVIAALVDRWNQNAGNSSPGGVTKSAKKCKTIY